MQFDPTLYVITDSTYHTTETLLHAVDEACRGGATLIQLREKDTGGRSYLELAQQVKAVTDRYNVPLIIDDRVDVAIACDAAGVHVGASDLPVAVCRRLLGPDKIVGATAKTVEAAVAAYNDGADYLGHRRHLPDDYSRYHQGYAGLRAERCVPRGADSGGCHRRPERG